MKLKLLSLMTLIGLWSIGQAKASFLADSLVFQGGLYHQEFTADGVARRSNYQLVLPFRSIPSSFYDAVAWAQFSTLREAQPLAMTCLSDNPKVNIGVSLAEIAFPETAGHESIDRLPSQYELRSDYDSELAYREDVLGSILFEIPYHSMPRYQTWEGQPSIEDFIKFNGPSGFFFTETWHYEDGEGLRMDIVAATATQELFDGDGLSKGHQRLCATPLPFPAKGETSSVPDFELRFTLDYLFESLYEEVLVHCAVEKLENREFAFLMKELISGVSTGDIKGFGLNKGLNQGQILSPNELEEFLNVSDTIPTFNLTTGEREGQKVIRRPLTLEEIDGLRVDATWKVYSNPFDIRKEVHGVVLLSRNSAFDPAPTQGQNTPPWQELAPIYFAMPSQP